MNNLSQKEIKDNERRAKMLAKDSAAQKRYLKKIVTRSIFVSLFLALIGGVIWLIMTTPPVPETDIVSQKGLHWHPTLTIYVGGVKQEIPKNIGLSAVHLPIHTHEEDSAQGVVHMEFGGVVQKRDTTLGHFFTNWGKDMRSFGTNIKMTVNGIENTEYENYIMKEDDKIELRFE